MLFRGISICILLSVVIATPPACFLSCINEVARLCPRAHLDIGCLCAKQEQVIGCLVDICPYGTFEASKDHYFGTCLEHKKPTYGNYPPDYPSGSDPQYGYPNPQYGGYPDLDSECLESSSTKATKTITIGKSLTYTTPAYTTISTPVYSNPYAKPTETEYYTDDESCEEDEEEELDCEWEEEQTMEEDGTIIIIRKPIRVADKYLKPPYSDPKRRKVIIKRPALKDSKKKSNDSKY